MGILILFSEISTTTLGEGTVTLTVKEKNERFCDGSFLYIPFPEGLPGGRG
jgi:hypothetical protein